MGRVITGLAALPLLAVAPFATAQDAPLNKPVKPVPQLCVTGINAMTPEALAEAIRARIAALPENRRSAEDIEAAMVYEISLHRLCAGVARSVLASMAGGTGALALAASRVAGTLLPSGNVGTAGIGNGGTGSGNSFFSAPIVGVGGGTSNYAQ